MLLSLWLICVGTYEKRPLLILRARLKQKLKSWLRRKKKQTSLQKKLCGKNLGLRINVRTHKNKVSLIHSQINKSLQFSNITSASSEVEMAITINL